MGQSKSYRLNGAAPGEVLDLVIRETNDMGGVLAEAGWFSMAIAEMRAAYSDLRTDITSAQATAHNLASRTMFRDR